MTTPATQNFTVYRGYRFFKTFTVNLDLTGYTIHMQARLRNDDAAPITGWNLSSPSAGISITPGASESTFTIDVAHGSTANITSSAPYEIMLIDGSGNRTPFMQGRLNPDENTMVVA